jgi:hypothetical protein
LPVSLHQKNLPIGKLLNQLHPSLAKQTPSARLIIHTRG